MTEDNFINNFNLMVRNMKDGEYNKAIEIGGIISQENTEHFNKVGEDAIASIYNNMGFCYEHIEGIKGHIPCSSSSYKNYKLASDKNHINATKLVWRAAVKESNKVDAIKYIKRHADMGDKDATIAIVAMESKRGWGSMISPEEQIHYSKKLLGHGYPKELIDKQINLIKAKNGMAEKPETLKEALKILQE